jgi:hypothetical protein
MVLIDDEISLIESSKEYLNVFLSEFGTFHPFAMIMDNEGIIYPLEHEIEEELPDPNSLIDLYERTFDNEIKKGNKYKLGILCIDVFIHSKDNTKRSAIEYRLTGTTYQKKLMQYYEIIEPFEVIFQELVGLD